jgi:hypothetical protein
MAPAPTVGAVFFPLDEELGLDESGLTPHAHECLARLAIWMPFTHAVEHLRALQGVQVSASTARRLCEQAGRAYEHIQSEQADPQGSERFPVPKQEPSERMAMSSDGALVSLRKGQWVEVKTLVIGEVLATKEGSNGKNPPRTTTHSYFSRMTDAATFADLASVEVQRRGLVHAKQVCAGP